MKKDEISFEETRELVNNWGRALYLDNRLTNSEKKIETPFDKDVSKPSKVQEFSLNAANITHKAKEKLDNFINDKLGVDFSLLDDKSIIVSWKKSVYRDIMDIQFEIFKNELASNIENKGAENALSLIPEQGDSSLYIKMHRTIGNIFPEWQTNNKLVPQTCSSFKYLDSISELIEVDIKQNRPLKK